jgi:hypothetical protein
MEVGNERDTFNINYTNRKTLSLSNSKIPNAHITIAIKLSIVKRAIVVFLYWLLSIIEINEKLSSCIVQSYSSTAYLSPRKHLEIT